MSAQAKAARRRERARARARRLKVEHDWPLARIARHLGVDVGTVRRWCADLLPADANARRYDRTAILAELQAREKSRSEIRAEYGCSFKFLSDLATGKIQP